LMIGLCLAGLRQPENVAQKAVIKTVQARMAPVLLKQLEGK